METKCLQSRVLRWRAFIKRWAQQTPGITVLQLKDLLEKKAQKDVVFEVRESMNGFRHLIVSKNGWHFELAKEKI